MNTYKGYISEEIPQQVIDEVIAYQEAVNQLLAPYWKQLTKEQKKSLWKIGEENYGFFDRGMEYIHTDPQYLPQYVDAAELKRDETMFRNTRKMLLPTKQNFKNLEILVTLSGADIIDAVLDYYSNVKRAALKRGDARAKVIYDDLKQRFARIRSLETMEEEESSTE